MPHWLDCFPEEYYLTGYVPVTQDADDSTYPHERVECFGGTRPFLRQGEPWPVNDEGGPLTFVGQMKDPRSTSAADEQIVYRIFVDTTAEERDIYDIEQVVKVDVIDIKHEKHNREIHGSVPGTSFPLKIITHWLPVKELNINKLMEDLYFNREAVLALNSNQEELKAIQEEDGPIDAHTIFDYINDGGFETQVNKGFKWGGYPQNWQGLDEAAYLMEKGFSLQWDTYENPDFDWMWGDAGIIYIHPETLAVTDTSA